MRLVSAVRERYKSINSRVFRSQVSSKRCCVAGCGPSQVAASDSTFMIRQCSGAISTFGNSLPSCIFNAFISSLLSNHLLHHGHESSEWRFFLVVSFSLTLLNKVVKCGFPCFQPPCVVSMNPTQPFSLAIPSSYEAFQAPRDNLQKRGKSTFMRHTRETHHSD